MAAKKKAKKVVKKVAISKKAVKSPAKKPAAKKKVAKKVVKKVVKKAAKKVTPKKAAKPVVKKAAKKPAKKAAPAKKAVVKKAVAPKVATPKAAQTKAVAPKAASPKAAQPKTAAPKATAPKAAQPKTATPKAAAPKAAQPKTAAPKPVSKKATAPIFKKETVTKFIIEKKVTPHTVSQLDEFAPVPKQTSISQAIVGPVEIEPYKPKPGEEYMSPGQLEHFREILNLWKAQLMQEVDSTVGHMKEDAVLYPDPLDRASQEQGFNLELRARDRERKLIKKIELSLDKIDSGEYGFCDSCGTEIGLRRLEARPTADLCIDCKTFEEIREKQAGF